MKKSDRDERFGALCDIGCIVCRNLGLGESPAEIHHIRTGYGMSQRAPDNKTIPLCPAHHRHGGYGVAYHAGPKIWQETYGTEHELLEQVNTLLVENGYSDRIL